jgi:hypothetical protein
MHRNLGAISVRLDCPVVRVGGVDDHVHILARQGRTITVAEWVKELERASSSWAKTQAASLRGFQWQAGYGAFSVSQSLSQAVERYIEGQAEHHRGCDFQTEFRKLLDAHGQACDERCTYGIEAVRRNPFRVEHGLTHSPQGRRGARQPWAMVRNAVGVEVSLHHSDFRAGLGWRLCPKGVSHHSPPLALGAYPVRSWATHLGRLILLALRYTPRP